ncbi:MAG: hypothetical protein E7L31_06870 [Aeromonas sp.]|nr:MULTISPECIES: hypothetical protein [Aeromonas]MDU7311101.1 hypothetical protein [Aeromonas sp.]MDX7804313.1 hypothetical protein [Aeromonas caviae]
MAVDLRPNRVSYGQWVGQHLDADSPMSLWSPRLCPRFLCSKRYGDGAL